MMVKQNEESISKIIFKHKYAFFLKDKEAEAGKTIELISEDSKNLVKGS